MSNVTTLVGTRHHPVTDAEFTAALAKVTAARFGTLLTAKAVGTTGWTVYNVGQTFSFTFWRTGARTFDTKRTGSFFARWVQDMVTNDVAWELGLTLKSESDGEKTCPVAPATFTTYTAWARVAFDDPTHEPSVTLRRKVPPPFQPFV